VALIFYVATTHGIGREKLRWLKQALGTQWAVTLGLAPATLFLFSQISIVGPLANAVAIPLVSMAVTPLALVAAVLPFDFIAQLAAWLLEWMMQFLEWCAALPAAVWQQHAPPAWSIALGLGRGGVDARAARRSVASERACAARARTRDAPGAAFARRGVDHDARCRSGASRSSCKRRAARCSTMRDRSFRPATTAASA
jgi:hypothetical protein